MALAVMGADRAGFVEMGEAEMKLCCKCKFFAHTMVGENKCWNGTVNDADPVHGGYGENLLCLFARSSGQPCGPEGKLFEAKT